MPSKWEPTSSMTGAVPVQKRKLNLESMSIKRNNITFPDLIIGSSWLFSKLSAKSFSHNVREQTVWITLNNNVSCFSPRRNKERDSNITCNGCDTFHKHRLQNLANRDKPGDCLSTAKQKNVQNISTCMSGKSTDHNS